MGWHVHGAGGAALLAALLIAAAGCADEGSPAPEASPRTPEVEAPSPDVATASPSPTVQPTPGARRTPDATPTAVACDDPLGCYGEPQHLGTFDAEAVPGASGLAASRRNPGLRYVLDDRPGTGEVWVMGEDGGFLGAITVAGLDALDTESLAVGPCGPADDAPCVYVGDIGDNLRSRRDIVVHRFAEPDLRDGLPAEPVVAQVARWTYPDEQHDAEALLVDDAGTPFVVTKAPFDPDSGETGETRLYRAPGMADGALEDLGVVDVPEPAQPLQSLFVGNVVTGGDYLDGRVLLRTYDQVLEFIAPEPGANLATLAEWHVREVPSAFELQSEAVAWEADGCGYTTVSEMVGDVWYVPCVP